MVSSTTLSAALGSPVSEVTVAELVSVPLVTVSTMTSIVNCFDAPLAIEPSSQVGTPLGSLPQPDVDTSVTPAGSVSVTTTFLASAGPAFETSTV